MRKVLRLLLIMIALAIVLMGCSEKEMQVEDINKNDSAEWIASLSSDVDAENMKDYDFSSLAMEYLEYIGQNLVNRDLDGADDHNMHEAAQGWIISELIHAGYSMDQLFFCILHILKAILYLIFVLKIYYLFELLSNLLDIFLLNLKYF